MRADSEKRIVEQLNRTDTSYLNQYGERCKSALGIHLQKPEKPLLNSGNHNLSETQEIEAT